MIRPPEISLDVSTLIPHRGESLLLERITDHDGEATTTRVVVGEQTCLLRDDGTVPTWLMVEYMAQTIAVHEGIVARREGRSLEIGFLVSVVRVEIEPVTLRSGELLDVRSERTRGRPGLGVVSHDCAVYRSADDGRRAPIARGRLSIAMKSLRAGGRVGDLASLRRTSAADRGADGV